MVINAGSFGSVQTAGIELADRGHSGSDDDGSHGEGDCVAEEEVVVGPVCVEVDEILSDILST